MNKFIKKTLSIVLVVLMLVSIPLTAFGESVNKTPIIYIAGINSSSLYYNGTRVWMPTVDDWDPVIDFLKGLTKLEDNGYNYDSFMTEKFVPVLKTATEPLRCNGDGESINQITYESTNLPYSQSSIARQKGGIQSDILKISADTIGGDRVFRYSYDFRISVLDHVYKLRQLVESAKEQCHAKKVRLVGVSMGGAVLNAYLNTYAHDDLESVTFLSSAAQGTNFPALMFSGEIQLTRDTIAACLNSLIGLVPSALIASLETSINQINELWSGDRITYFYDNWVKDYLGKWCGLWNLVPSEKIDSCIDFMLDKDADAGLIKKIKRYQACQDNLQDVLNKCKEDGVEVYVLSSYNIHAIPFKGNNHQNDILIDTEYCTLGARAATFVEGTLGDNYKQEVDDGKERVSCDNIIDASTCWFPDQTWIIKNMVHCMYVEKTDKDEVDETGVFFKWFISAKKPITVESDSRWTQFMDYTKSTGKLVPLEPVVIETEESTGDYVSSAVTVYRYTQITALGWALIAAIAVAIIILISKKKNKEPIEGVLSKAEIKALPKEERKAAKKQNKALTKEWKGKQKAAKKARKAELKAMPKAERKAAIKAEKAEKKAAAKQAKAHAKADKAQKKADKKAAKAEKKAAPAAEATQEEQPVK